MNPFLDEWNGHKKFMEKPVIRRNNIFYYHETRRKNEEICRISQKRVQFRSLILHKDLLHGIGYKIFGLKKKEEKNGAFIDGK